MNIRWPALVICLTAGCGPDPAQQGHQGPMAGKQLVARATFEYGEDGWYRDHRVYREQGEYILVGLADHAYSFRRFNVDDPVVSVDIRPVRNDNPKFGFGLNLCQQDDPSNRYSFWINDRGEYVFYRFQGGTHHELIPWTAHPAIRPGAGMVNNLRVHQTGDRFTFYINGTLVNEAVDGTYRTGSIAFFANARQVIAFDNFELYQ